ncbi:MAG: hypothetical protein N3A01_06765 [Bacteroidales bacterium]|nr:hypothetical protein [Bacteroidales bacterium]
MNKDKYIIGISPCPNDIFMFEAIINKRISIDKNIMIEFLIEDISSLNALAEKENIDVIKLSTYTYYRLQEKYKHSKSGAVIGFENGPLLISKKKIYPDEIPYVKIGIPGKNTTAYSLLKLFYETNDLIIKEYKYNQIFEAIMDNEIDAGILIHEQRFTIEKYKVNVISNFSDLWYNKHFLPLPLAVIGINNNVNKEMFSYFELLIKRSIMHAFQNPNDSKELIKKYAHIKNEDILRRHIETFVNTFSLDMGYIGEKAINKLFEEYKNKNL